MPATLEGPDHPPLAVLIAVALVISGLASRRRRRRAADPLPALPPGWPSDRVELGLADAPGGAASLRASAPFEFRYQYLAGGVNTGNGWSTWNTNGQFVSWYVADSADHGALAVFPYYMLLQSNPATGGTEPAKDLSNLANPATMAAVYADLRLFFQRAAGAQTVVLHVEPDLWGYIEQATGTNDDATTFRRPVASSGDAALAGLPNTAAGFAGRSSASATSSRPTSCSRTTCRCGARTGTSLLEQPGPAGRRPRRPRRPRSTTRSAPPST